VIIEVDGGKYEKLHIVRRDVRKKGVQHHVLWDRDCQNTTNYGVTAWPAAYLIGPDGKVVWNGNPARVVNRRNRLKKLLDQIQEQLDRTKSQRAIAKNQKPKSSQTD